MIRLPHAGRRSRLLALGYGMIVFVWITLEDNAVWPVSVLGLELGLLIMYLTIADKMGGQTFPVRWLPLVGAVSGALTGLAAGIGITGLMFFKNAVHAHIFPDFPPGLMLAMLQRTPTWTAVGALAGLGFGLVWIALATEVNF